MGVWWENLDPMSQFFYLVAIPSTLILVMQTILTLIGISGGDSDFSADSGEGGDLGDGIDLDGDGTPDFSADFHMFSLRGIIAFFSVFGWVGVILSEGENWLVTLIAALASGFIAMLAIAYLFYGVSKLQASGNINYAKAVGKTATVYLKIPAKGSGGQGKINLVLNDSLVEMGAVTEEDRPIPSGQVVHVERVLAENIAQVVAGKKK